MWRRIHASKPPKAEAPSSDTMPPEHKYSLPQGYRLRQYIIVRLLGHGGFGLTYLAEDTKLGRKVAIKELLPTDFAIRATDGTTVVARSQGATANLDWARQRFVEEGRTLAGLDHLSILRIFEIFEQHGTAYLVTAFIEGDNLEHWLRKVQRPTEKDLRSTTLCLLEALAIVHQRGYLHRDVKPENILMDQRSGRPILIDFGNARIATGLKTANLTAVITKGYAPFEQYQTKGRQGPFTDIYALGAVLYRAVTGAAPEDAADRVDGDKVEPLRHRPPPGYSREFLATVDRALHMRREDRWQTCDQWAAALQVREKTRRQIAPGAGPVQSPVQTPTQSPVRLPFRLPVRWPAALSWPSLRRSRFALAAAALGLFTLAGVGIGLLINPSPDHDQTPTPTPSPMVDNVRPSPTPQPSPIAFNSPRPFFTPSPGPGFPTPWPVIAPTPPPWSPPRSVATADRPLVNSLGQQFVPVPGTNVLFCRWDTRVVDWEAFIREAGDSEQSGIVVNDMQTGNLVGRNDLSWRNPGYSQSGDHPVVGVSWVDAHRFCEWLSKKEGRKYRLPTDAEWSVAAGPEKYPWGSQFPPPKGAGNYGDRTFAKSLPHRITTPLGSYDDGYTRTSPVGSFPANRFGLYDMGGNVWQWLEDPYLASMNTADQIKRLPGLRNEISTDGMHLVTVRGGSWLVFIESFMRSSYHDPVHPGFRGDKLGFRCVLDLSGG
jgi:serine/threonine protein kinase